METQKKKNNVYKLVLFSSQHECTTSKFSGYHDFQAVNLHQYYLSIVINTSLLISPLDLAYAYLI